MDDSKDIEFNGVIIRPIPGYEKEYAADREGEIYTLQRKFVRKTRKLKQHLSSKGYMEVKLYKNGKYKKFTVHRLIAITFIPNPDNLATVNHKNEVKTCNRESNLEWMSQSDNYYYGSGIQRSAKNRMKPIVAVKMSDGSIKEYESIIASEKDGFRREVISKTFSDKFPNNHTHRGYRFYKKEDYEKLLEESK